MNWHSFVQESVIEIGSEAHITSTLVDIPNSKGETGPTSPLVLDLQVFE